VQLVDEQPLVGEQAERLAQRVARDPQHLHELLLRQPAARAQVAVGDAPPQDVGDALGRAAAVERRGLRATTRSQPGVSTSVMAHPAGRGDMMASLLPDR
jgi:hypothetical protein